MTLQKHRVFLVPVGLLICRPSATYPSTPVLWWYIRESEVSLARESVTSWRVYDVTSIILENRCASKLQRCDNKNQKRWRTERNPKSNPLTSWRVYDVTSKNPRKPLRFKITTLWQQKPKKMKNWTKPKIESVIKLQKTRALKVTFFTKQKLITHNLNTLFESNFPTKNPFLCLQILNSTHVLIAKRPTWCSPARLMIDH